MTLAESLLDFLRGKKADAFAATTGEVCVLSVTLPQVVFHVNPEYFSLKLTRDRYAAADDSCCFGDVFCWCRY